MEQLRPNFKWQEKIFGVYDKGENRPFIIQCSLINQPLSLPGLMNQYAEN
jgi:hypothetical protein